MRRRVTNAQLHQLLSDLGFESRPGETDKFVIVFDHPVSGAQFLMLSGRDDEPATWADLASVRMHLYCRGHLDRDEFDEFLDLGVLKAS